MTNPHYNHSSGVPLAQTRGLSSAIRGEYDLIEDGFDAVNVQLLLRGSIAGQVWTGTHNFTGTTLTAPTRALGDSTTNVATTAYAMTMQSPAFSGTPTVPTPGSNINTTQVPTTAWVNTWYAAKESPTFTGTATLPATTSIGTVSATEIGYLDNVTSSIQTQLNAKAALASPTFTGVPAAPTATPGDSGTTLATTAFVSGAIASVNAQTPLSVAVASGTTQLAVSGSHYVLTNVAATTLTLPAAPASGETVWVTTTNGLSTNVIARNGKTIMALAEDMTLNLINQTIRLRYVNTDWKLV